MHLNHSIYNDNIKRDLIGDKKSREEYLD